MIQPSVFGQAIIITVYIPILALTGVEGKMFQPMALTVIFALAAAFVLSLTFIPAMVALCIAGASTEKENVLIRGAKRLYEPRPPGRRSAAARRGRSRPRCCSSLSLWLFSTLGQEFVPTLDEQDIALQAIRIPSTGLTQSPEMQFAVERTVRSFPEVAFVFSKTGTAEMAADPMPPNVSDTFVILKPHDRVAGPGVDEGRASSTGFGRRSRNSPGTTTSSRSRSRCGSTSSSPASAATSR